MPSRLIPLSIRLCASVVLLILATGVGQVEAFCSLMSEGNALGVPGSATRPASGIAFRPFALAKGVGAERGPHTEADAGTITGTVVDPDGRPVPNAEVLVTRAAGIAARARTDGTGRFEVAELGAGQYEVHVAVEGFSAEPQRVAVVASQRAEVSVRLHVSAVSESVVVSAAQVDVPLSRVADSVTVISRRDIAARQFETVGEALRMVPGVEVAMNGGRGSVTSLFARGGESDYSLVLVDGVRANAFGGGFDFSQLPIANVERIEVVRGPGSALFGSDAIGAVVSIVTRRGGKPRATASLETGSLATRRLTASASGSRGAWSWGGGIERTTSEGFTGTAPATGERVTNDDYRAHQGTGVASWRNGKGAEVGLNAAWTRSDRGFPGPFGSNPIGAFSGVDRLSRGLVDTRQASASAIVPLVGGRMRQHAQLSLFDLASDFKSLYGLSSSGTRRVAIRSQTDVPAGSNTEFSLGLDVQHETAKSTFITGTASAPVPINRNLVGVFAEARHQQGSRLTLTAGLRLEQVARNGLDGSPNPFSPRPPFAPDTARALNPKASLAYLLYTRNAAAGIAPSWVRVRASGGTGMRAPDGLEIAFTDNPHLKPERSGSGEVGIESGFAGGKLSVEATYFANRYDDLIVAVGQAMRDASRYQTDNIANARAEGTELAARLRTGWGVEARLAYTWLDTAVLAVDRAGMAPAPFNVGDWLLRRPRHQASMDVVFARGPLSAYSQIGVRGRTLDVEPSYGAYGGVFRNSGYTTVRCGASWQLASAIALTARIDNLFDRRYEETFGFPALGRTVMAGVRVAAGR